jgi:hypothetical protein
VSQACPELVLSLSKGLSKGLSKDLSKDAVLWGRVGCAAVVPIPRLPQGRLVEQQCEQRPFCQPQLVSTLWAGTTPTTETRTTGFGVWVRPRLYLSGRKQPQVYGPAARGKRRR